MKKILYMMIVFTFIMTSCQQKTKAPSFDQAAVKTELTQVMDNIYKAYNAKDTTALMAFLTVDGLFCGTDPKEFWDKAAYARRTSAAFADTSYKPNLKVDKREIQLASDGNSAIVVDQFFMEWSKQIPVRNIFHMVKSENKWFCDFLGSNLAPTNEDMPKIIGAVK
jgi:ketosteroid isomerase-like protein